MSNQISAVLSEADLQAVKDLLSQLETKMPFLLEGEVVTGKGKQNLGKNALSFATKALSVAKAYPEILTRDFSVEEFEKDVLLFHSLLDVLLKLQPIFYKIAGTRTIAGQEVMAQSNEVYSFTKLASKKNNKFKAIAQELGEFYKKSKKEDTEPVPTSN